MVKSKGTGVIVRAVIGTIFGLILYYLWIFILIKLQFVFFQEETVIHGTQIIKARIPEQYLQITQWLSTGLLPFFLIAGYYLLFSNTTGGIEKTRDIIIIKSILLGFFIWLFVIVISFLLEININSNIKLAHYRELITNSFLVSSRDYLSPHS